MLSAPLKYRDVVLLAQPRQAHSMAGANWAAFFSGQHYFLSRKHITQPSELALGNGSPFIQSMAEVVALEIDKLEMIGLEGEIINSFNHLPKLENARIATSSDQVS
jgi:hypothetical protein